jgi:hypothetical protein
MIKSALVLGLLISINCAFSHSPNEVSFSIYEKDTSILVDTEFPWSLRNAVFISDSTLNDSSSFEEIKASLFKYVNQNFVITGVNGEQIKLLKLIDLKNQGHHENYQFVFEKKEIGKIKNTLLFNFSSKQKNFHLLQLNGEKLEFVLTKKNQEITIKETRTISNLVIAFSLVFLFIVVFFLKKKFKSSSV